MVLFVWFNYKTEVMLFPRLYKKPNFNPPTLNRFLQFMSKRVKYLEIILDPKLWCKNNVIERTNKATLVFYASRRVIGKMWGLRPTSTHRVYRAVVEQQSSK